MTILVKHHLLIITIIIIIMIITIIILPNFARAIYFIFLISFLPLAEINVVR